MRDFTNKATLSREMDSAAELALLASLGTLLPVTSTTDVWSEVAARRSLEVEDARSKSVQHLSETKPS